MHVGEEQVWGENQGVGLGRHLPVSRRSCRQAFRCVAVELREFRPSCEPGSLHNGGLDTTEYGRNYLESSQE